ncbi:MAG: DUF4202 domain-containing protein [Verrucomicrobiae bacterium]|nr:DUF4202 domain-containing protein [Verrucomicrobiae bacterium]
MDFETSERFREAITRFDALNAGDPNREKTPEGEQPRELVYARRLTEWVLTLQPEASEALQLAARCQHLCRWEIPRDTYAADRAGYLKWRRDLQQFHARRAGEVLSGVGYDMATLDRVRDLNLKKDLGRDPEVQVLEDALCLVFLQYQLAGLAERTEDGKLVNALRKSWGKMSSRGREAALGLSYGDRERSLLGRALEATDAGQEGGVG